MVTARYQPSPEGWFHILRSEMILPGSEAIRATWNGQGWIASSRLLSAAGGGASSEAMTEIAPSPPALRKRLQSPKASFMVSP
jgi:hypothetical protein